MCGDNKNSVHDLKDLTNTDSIVVAYCTHCRKKFNVKPQDRKRFAKLFKALTLQPHQNLYYKVHPERMNIAH